MMNKSDQERPIEELIKDVDHTVGLLLAKENSLLQYVLENKNIAAALYYAISEKVSEQEEALKKRLEAIGYEFSSGVTESQRPDGDGIEYDMDLASMAMNQEKTLDTGELLGFKEMILSIKSGKKAQRLILDGTRNKLKAAVTEEQLQHMQKRSYLEGLQRWLQSKESQS